MDTIQISIKLNKNKMEKISYEELQGIRKFIRGIISPYGYYYCDCLGISVTANLIVKISYPRFYAGINAYLISNERQCMDVQNHFCMEIRSNFLLQDATIELTRVDIPFTFLMGESYDFNSYMKVYQVFNYVYKRKNVKASPKAFSDIENFKVETLIYADTPNIASYNSKIMIYDQYNNIKVKTGEAENLYEIESKYEDLHKRMRIEVSKRINRRGFTVNEFSRFDIFGEYSIKYKNYILDNILDLNEIENFYNEKAIELSQKLSFDREESNYFIYESFIYREIRHIYDYEIIRRALKICIDNRKTREKAVTSIRKVLNTYESNENIIVMEVYNIIKEIRHIINNYFVR